MCRCTPTIRTPFCGRPGCEVPENFRPKRPAPLELAERAARNVGQTIGAQMPVGWGFALVMFSIDDGMDGNMTYLSNLRRPDMVKALRELADKLESGAPER